MEKNQFCQTKAEHDIQHVSWLFYAMYTQKHQKTPDWLLDPATLKLVAIVCQHRRFAPSFENFSNWQIGAKIGVKILLLNPAPVPAEACILGTRVGMCLISLSRAPVLAVPQPKATNLPQPILRHAEIKLHATAAALSWEGAGLYSWLRYYQSFYPPPYTMVKSGLNPVGSHCLFPQHL